MVSVRDVAHAVVNAAQARLADMQKPEALQPEATAATGSMPPMQKKLDEIVLTAANVERRLDDTALLVRAYADSLEQRSGVLGAKHATGAAHRPSSERMRHLRDKHANDVYERNIAQQAAETGYRRVNADIVDGAVDRTIDAIREIVPAAVAPERVARAVQAMNHETLAQWPPMASDAAVRKQNRVFSARCATHVRICRKAVDELSDASRRVTEKNSTLAPLRWSKKQSDSIRKVCSELADVLITKAYPALGYANCASHDPLELLKYREIFAAEEAQSKAAETEAAEQLAEAAQQQLSFRRAEKKTRKAARAHKTAQREYFDRYGTLSASADTNIRDWFELLAFTERQLPGASEQTIKALHDAFKRTGIGLIPAWEKTIAHPTDVERAQEKAVSLVTWLFAYASPAEKLAFAERLTRAVEAAGSKKHGGECVSLSDHDVEKYFSEEPHDAQTVAGCIQTGSGGVRILVPDRPAFGNRPPEWCGRGFTAPPKLVADICVYALFDHDSDVLRALSRLYGVLDKPSSR